MFAATAIPSLCFLLASLLIPESPRWLAARGDQQKALKVLERLGGKAQAQTVMDELSALDHNKPQQQSLRKALSVPGVRKALLLGVVLAVLQQWSGVNVIFNYAQEIFSAAGYQVSDILINIVINGLVNVVFTIVAMFAIDRVGRRFLLLLGVVV